MLDIKPFFKPTNKSSAHPRNIFKSLIKGELTRLLRACSDKETFENVSNKLLKALAERGYPNQLLQDTLQQVPFERRTKILEGKEKEEIKYDTFFKIDYTPDLNTKKLRQIIQPHKDEGSNIPHPCVSLKKKDNLAKKLVCAKLKGFKPPPSSTTPITIEATKPKKKNQPSHAKTTDANVATPFQTSVESPQPTTIKHSQPKNIYQNIIYLIKCTKCLKRNQYVGQTSRPLKIRMKEHRAASKIKTNFPLYKHFIQNKNHDFERDAKVTILQATTRSRLLERELHWIKSMDTTYPKGLNCNMNY